MTFRRIDYLEWARTHMGRVKFDLARSNIKGLTKDELGVPLRDAPLAPPDDDGERRPAEPERPVEHRQQPGRGGILGLRQRQLIGQRRRKCRRQRG